MIALSCPHCQKHLKVKDELAGKKIRCPACKETVEVTVTREDATLPPSSPPQEDATLPPSPASNGEATVGLPGEGAISSLVVASSSHQRYEVESEIARGGMGAIMRANDRDIDREVAIKYLLNQADERQKVRFVEEAKITGQLEHPNIVPIHDLGLDAEGQMYFSMKMVKGRSLAEILKDLDETTKYTLSRLLTVFSNVCNALAYAHSRNVIHRDLKPANIMIGDFGEVYVMDWGVAKVLTSRERQRTNPAQTQLQNSASPTLSGGMVKTNRTQAADLTQDGAIMGTPAYMPPEQARGEIDAIDRRSDIYSLGAILYEMLTLTPPVGRGGDAMAILMRVVDGTIDLPTKRAPKRWIPAELSAIAMKALAMDPADRYQTVEELQHDIHLYQEGRSVSAKQDSAWEIFKKLVKRNKGASLGAAVALLVLMGSLFFIGKAYVELKQEQGAKKKEQREKEERTRLAIPALVKASRLSVDRREFDEALTQVNLALVYDPSNVDALLLKAQLLVARKDFAGGVRELDDYLKARPDDTEAHALRELCTVSNPKETVNLLKIAQLFVRLKITGLAEAVLKEFGTNVLEARKQLLEMYRRQVEKGWPGLGSRLTLDNSGLFQLNLKGNDEVTTFAPLEGIPLSTIEIATGKNNVSDLTPLRGMPLTTLKLTNCPQVRDLSPLQGLQLQSLLLGHTSELMDLSPLRGMPLVSLNLLHCTNVSDLSPLEGMPLTNLNIQNCSKVTDLSPLEEMNLTSIYFDPRTLGNPKSMKVLRGIKTLTTITVASKGSFTAEQFWEKYDRGELIKK